MPAISPQVREARLRPEFAELYPGIEPGVWHTAATLAGHLLARLMREDAAPLPARVLEATHFEFRGESPPSLDERIDLG